MGSLFDGSGGFPLGGLLHGIEPVWASEVEPYPIAVTKLHFPNMKHLGDVSKIHGWDIDPVDVVTFGSPCQDMSIAGKRAGLLHTAKGDDTTTRSGLFYEAIRIMKEMREATHGKYPSFAVWENVPGALTSAKGEDFRCVLQELLQIAEGGELSVPRPANGKWLHAGEILADHCSIAWRILDAQYWGVPQRRKRIYLVADFGGQRAGEILFERESMRGYFAQGGEARQGTADDAAGGVGGSDCVKCLNLWDCQSKRQYTIDGAYTTLNAGQAQGGQAHGICYDAASFMGGQGTKAGGIGYSEEVSPTLKSVLSGGNTVPDVVYPEIARTLAARHDSSPCADRGQNVVALDCRNLVGNQEISGTLQSKDEGGYSLNYVNPVVYDCRVIPLNEQVIMRHNKLGKGTGFGAGNIGDHAFTLQASHPHMIACDAQAVVYSSGSYGALSEGVGCIGTGARATAEMVAVYDCAKPPRKYILRRLTPLECNRLQGFPDFWGFIPHKDVMTDEEYQFWTNVRNTHIAINGKTPKSFSKNAMLDWYNKLHTDSAEYKMWGNGVAEPCVCFVMDGIARAMAEQWAGPCANRKE